MTIEDTRNSDSSYSDWPVAQQVRREVWRVRSVQDFPSLGEGFIVPTVYRPDEPDKPFDFTVDMRHWRPEFDDWVQRGMHLLITGELYLAVKNCEYEPHHDENAAPFIGYVKPSRRVVHEIDAMLRVQRMLTQGTTMADGRARFNHWAMVSYQGEAWRARFPGSTPDLAEGRYYRCEIQRRIDIQRFEPWVPPTDEDAKLPF